MRVITIASSKGGVGKTTLASALAIKAAIESATVGMVDLDPLGSLAAWWARRGRTENPEIFTGADTATEAVEKLEGVIRKPDEAFDRCTETGPALLPGLFLELPTRIGC